jgi:predicted anti-sigma-YlaC factor YlaD
MTMAPDADGRRSVSCERWIEALSAQADSEDPGIDARLIDAHLRGCAACRSYRNSLYLTRPVVRLDVVASTPPDLSRRVVRRNAAADRVSQWGLVRLLLGAVAVQIAVLAIPDLWANDSAPAIAHASRHLGAFSVAYAVGLMLVVVRPARARTLLPVSAVLALALVLTAIVDIAEARVPLVGETRHLPEVLSVPLVWLMANPRWRLPRRRSANVDASSNDGLRLLDGAAQSPDADQTPMSRASKARGSTRRGSNP